jgi:2-polyprenyl-3-methyl-5-hydroxy-6-metoxy-1,4-benzoquinol methylase
MKPIRTHYAESSVEVYYETYSDVYENPHFPYITTLLKQNTHRIDYTQVLDLSAGGGEVSMILKDLGHPNTTGTDPFTHQLYQKQLHTQCYQYSFEDIIKGKSDQANWPPFSAIICSFAMHLCPEKQLYPLTQKLFTHSPQIIIITPHKRPALEKLSGVTLEFDDHTFTLKGKKVFLKSYRLE